MTNQAPESHLGNHNSEPCQTHYPTYDTSVLPRHFCLIDFTTLVSTLQFRLARPPQFDQQGHHPSKLPCDWLIQLPLVSNRPHSDPGVSPGPLRTPRHALERGGGGGGGGRGEGGEVIQHILAPKIRHIRIRTKALLGLENPETTPLPRHAKSESVLRHCLASGTPRRHRPQDTPSQNPY
ncbi:hypothetical protein C4D60_Mb03t04890 [Musa balbisiana]|uniref:Uncharacterized protein n=1 Tax=Musa balbisiana TaxID=52838 RepID=A0A4S8J7K5_MUSBA|nr:hypothetical protein C4D60_Mb03t04890 [Musa balbisiana]